MSLIYTPMTPADATRWGSPWALTCVGGLYVAVAGLIWLAAWIAQDFGLLVEPRLWGMALATLAALAVAATWKEAHDPDQRLRLWFYFLLRLVRFALVPVGLAASVASGAVIYDAVWFAGIGAIDLTGINAAVLSGWLYLFFGGIWMAGYGISIGSLGVKISLSLMALPFFGIIFAGPFGRAGDVVTNIPLVWARFVIP